MDEQTRKALELARESLFSPSSSTFFKAIDAIDAALSAPAAPVAQPLPACHVAVIGDRWDSERLHHVPQLLIEFEPVPANTGNTAKGWIDRDSLAKILSGIGQGGA